jgi:hypothetical protein
LGLRATPTHPAIHPARNAMDQFAELDALNSFRPW